MSEPSDKPNAVVEPVLEMDDIQGLAVPGFIKPHHALLGIRIPPGGSAVREFKALLGNLAGEVASATETLGNRRLFRRQRTLETRRHPLGSPSAAFVGLGFSHAALLRLTPGAAYIPSEAFRQGLVGRSALLGDPADRRAEGHPSNWVVGAPGRELDMLILVAGDHRAEVEAKAEQLRPRLMTGAEIAYEENGDVRSDLPGHEMFGFDDGISQPGIRGRASAEAGDFITARHIAPTEIPDNLLFGYPGQDLVWPGIMVLGYPEASPDPLIAGPPAPAVPEWTRNGSYLVFRRLRQDVGLFWRTMRDKAAKLSGLPGFQGMTDERLASLLLGRWPSGAPVCRVPGGDNPALGEQPLANNNFRFDSDSFPLATVSSYQDNFPMAKADPAGVICPWTAHIRKVNTRDSGSDMGGTDSRYKRRILRIGLPFGKPLADRYAPLEQDPEKGKRGLLFLSIQASIDDQFEFLAAQWMNDPERPKMPGGHDLLVGQNSTPGERRERRGVLFGSGLQQTEITMEHQFVIPTGGGYFFVPSISALREVLAR